MAVLIYGRHYTIPITITNPGAVSNLGAQAAATKPFVLIKARIALAQATVPAAADARIKVVRKTATPTYTAIAATGFLNHDPTDADASLTAGHTASGEGTDGDGFEDGWGSTTGWVWEWAPTPEDYLMVPAGTANGIALKSTVAPPAGVYTFYMTVVELG